ncbi:si:ch211-255f4.7 [Nephila pilipes]|uniref:Si:ch211-255f4.7 n=1 Tax=Nephila pilipes TaxID=299642 RepID=A0A8X6MYX8_NEPPI|nr:si:ch211-255f4.7 [Nephila pilipes]
MVRQQISGAYFLCPLKTPLRCMQKVWSKKDKNYAFVNSLSIVKSYNLYMGGVDFLDRVISYYRIWFRTKKVHHSSYNALCRDFAIAASWIEYRQHKRMSSAPISDYFDHLAFRIKIQEYLFHGSEGGDKSKYEPSEPPTSQKRKMSEKFLCHQIDHLRKKQNLHLPEIPQPASINQCRMSGCQSNSARMRCTTCKVFLRMQED